MYFSITHAKYKALKHIFQQSGNANILQEKEEWVFLLMTIHWIERREGVEHVEGYFSF